MINIDKHIKHWQIGAQEDWTIGKQLVKENKVRHGLFFIHLALEKILKALVCKMTNDLAPRLHNLVRLVERTGLSLTDAQLDCLIVLNLHNIEGRYPELLAHRHHNKKQSN